MIIEGYIIMNVRTSEVLRQDNGEYVFEDIGSVCEFVADRKLRLTDYVVHQIHGDIFEFAVSAETTS